MSKSQGGKWTELDNTWKNRIKFNIVYQTMIDVKNFIADLFRLIWELMKLVTKIF